MTAISSLPIQWPPYGIHPFGSLINEEEKPHWKSVTADFLHGKGDNLAPELKKQILEENDLNALSPDEKKRLQHCFEQEIAPTLSQDEAEPLRRKLAIPEHNQQKPVRPLPGPKEISTESLREFIQTSQTLWIKV